MLHAIAPFSFVAFYLFTLVFQLPLIVSSFSKLVPVSHTALPKFYRIRKLQSVSFFVCDRTSEFLLCLSSFCIPEY